MSRTNVLLTVLTLASLALAGCIEPPGGDDDFPLPETPTGTRQGTMTADEERADKDATPCLSGGVGFCAERVVRVTGAVSGMDLLEVSLATVNGAVKVEGGEGDAWSLVATLKARGTTAEEARRNLDTIEFAWSHESDGAHFLLAEAKFPGRTNDNSNRQAHFELVMPRALPLRLVAQTTNGGVAVKDVRTDGLSAGTTNGGIDVDAHVTQVQLGTTNGGIDARLTPTASGRITLGTTNGGIQLKLPEDASRGYELEGATTNGEVEIELRDGKVGPCPEGSQYYTPPCNHRTFETSGYASRDVRSSVHLGTTNGDVAVAPA